MKHCIHGLQGLEGSSLWKQSKSREEAGVKVHREHRFTVGVPFSSVVEDPEVVFHLTRGSSLQVVFEKGLGANKFVWKRRVDEDLVLE